MKRVIHPILGTLPYLIDRSGTVFTLNQIPITTRIDKDGYVTVRFKINGKRRHFYIHRLMGFTYIPNPENKPFINHKDGNKLNNDVTNLEWCTSHENNQHAYNIGLRISPKGINHHNSKLSNTDVQYIKEHFVKGISKYKEFALRLNVSPGTIHGIVNGKRWTHI